MTLVRGTNNRRPRVLQFHIDQAQAGLCRVLDHGWDGSGLPVNRAIIKRDERQISENDRTLRTGYCCYRGVLGESLREEPADCLVSCQLSNQKQSEKKKK